MKWSRSVCLFGSYAKPLHCSFLREGEGHSYHWTRKRGAPLCISLQVVREAFACQGIPPISDSLLRKVATLLAGR
jgi:hypothetical protein